MTRRLWGKVGVIVHELVFTPMASLGDATLNALRVRITRVLPMQVHEAVAALTDDQVWWRPNEKANSVGNLVLHLSGSLDTYLNRQIGGHAYTRDRNAEFAQRGGMTKAQILARFDEMVKRADKTFERLDPATLIGPSADPEHHDFLIDDLVGIATHLATHVGQILWITKMLSEGSLDETWMRAHKRGGAWKR